MSRDVDTKRALERGVDALVRHQRDDGDWEGEVVWCAMLACQYAMMTHITGTPISEGRRTRIVQQLRATQLPSGLWGLHLEQSAPYLFTTALAYVTARIMGVGRDDPMLGPARAFIEREGGVVGIPSWGKLWLALMNLYDWDGVNAVIPEAWLLPERFFLHPSHYYCHTRLIYMGMATVYGEKHQTPRTPLLEELRQELYPQGYDAVDWPKARNTLRQDDLYVPPSLPLKGLYEVSRAVDKVHPAPVRQRMLEDLRQRIRWELRTTAHTCLSPVNGLLNLVALWIADPDDPDFHAGLEAFEGWVWEDDEDGLRVAGARSASWDTAFAVQALTAAGQAGADVSAPIARGLGFLETQQVPESFPGFRDNYRDDPKGGWTFAGVWHGWPVSDCTAEAILAALEAPGYEPSHAMVEDATRFILRRQNVDGGFGSYEAKRPRRIELEWLNPAEMFGDSMTEHSYLECTVSCLTALVRAREHMPALMPRQVDRAVERAARFIRDAQHDDGKWPTAWGVGYIYATMFGVRGLLAAGATPDDPAVRAACRWLLDRQLPDGSWGESHEGCLLNEWVSMDHGHPIQTAWALTALLEAREPQAGPLDRAAAWLAAEQGGDGEWPEREMVGIFFHTALLHYRHYKRYFPVWALGLYEQRRARYKSSRDADDTAAAAATAPAE